MAPLASQSLGLVCDWPTQRSAAYGFLTGGEDHYSEATICGAPVCGIHTKSIDIWDSESIQT